MALQYFYSPQQEGRILELTVRVQEEVEEDIYRSMPISTFLRDSARQFNSKELNSLPMSLVYWANVLDLCERNGWELSKATESAQYLCITQHARGKLVEGLDSKLQKNQFFLNLINEKFSSTSKKNTRFTTPAPQAKVGLRFRPQYELSRGTDIAYLLYADESAQFASGKIARSGESDIVIAKKESFLKLCSLEFYVQNHEQELKNINSFLARQHP